jgi:hypothetical protein
MTGGKFPPDADKPPMALLYTVIGLVVLLILYLLIFPV